MLGLTRVVMKVDDLDMMLAVMKVQMMVVMMVDDLEMMLDM